MIAWKTLSAIAVFAFLSGVKAQAQDTGPKGASTRPLWELGVATVGSYSPDYPAADKNSLHLLAIPNLIYREIFSAWGETASRRVYSLKMILRN